MDKIYPVFVVGHPHSGTTLVQLLIIANPIFSSGPETHFFRYVMKPIRGWRHSKLSQDQLDLVFERLQHKDIFLPQDTKAAIKEKAGNDGIAPATLLNELMAYFAGQAGTISKRWLEKTPEHALFIPEILALFPNAKIVNVVRDPRDVVSSLLRFHNLDSDRKRRLFLADRAKRWKRLVSSTTQLTSLQKQILTIRYEDIVENPKISVRKIMHFLRAEYHSQNIDKFSENYDLVVTAQEEWKTLCATGKIIDRRGVWRTRMSEDDAKVVELMCMHTMKKSGYILNDFSRLRTLKICINLFFDWTFTNLSQLFMRLRGVLN
jgi:hypothetical protein